MKNLKGKTALITGVTGLIADQSSLHDIEALAAAVAGCFGKIDILLVNAGVSKFLLIEHMEEAVFDEVMI